jgi:hypothetical protein
MSFNKEAEDNELELHIALKFDSGKPTVPHGLSIGPNAFLFLGRHTCDENGNIMLTSREMSFETLKGQIDAIKAALDARLAEAKARFLAASP